MWNRTALILLVSLVYLAGIACDSNTGDPTDPGTAGAIFDETLACTGDCLEDFGAVMDVLIHVLKKVDEPATSLPPGIAFNTDSVTTFESDLHLDTSPGVDGRLRGRVAPPPSDPTACSDGMQQGDVCIFRWVVTEGASGPDTIAKGNFSAVDLGITGPPLNTTATRFTIVDSNAVLMASDDCAMTVTAFEMMWHLPMDDLYSFYLDFSVIYSSGSDLGTMNGSLIAGGGSEATLTLTSGTRTQDCTVDIRTFEMSCS